MKLSQLKLAFSGYDSDLNFPKWNKTKFKTKDLVI